MEEVPESKIKLLPQPPVWASFCSSLLLLTPETTWERGFISSYTSRYGPVTEGSRGRGTEANYLFALYDLFCLLACLTKDHLPMGSTTHINH